MGKFLKISLLIFIILPDVLISKPQIELLPVLNASMNISDLLKVVMSQ